MVINIGYPEDPSRDSGCHYHGMLSAEHQKHLEESARILHVPVHRLLQLSDEGRASDFTYCDPAYPQAAPREKFMSYPTDILNAQRRNARDAVTTGQPMQAPLTPETLTDVPNHVADDLPEPDISHFSEERPIDASQNRWQVQSATDPSDFPRTVPNEPIIFDHEYSHPSVPLSLPGEMGTMLGLDSSSHHLPLQEPITGSYEPRPASVLNSFAALDRAFPMSSAPDGYSHSQEPRGGGSQIMPWQSSYTTMIHAMPNRRVDLQPETQKFPFQHANALQEQRPGDVVTTIATAVQDQNNSSLALQRQSKRTPSESAAHKGSDSRVQKRKRCDFVEPLGTCRRCAGFNTIHPLCSFTQIVDINLFRLHTDPNVPQIPELGIDQALIDRVDGRRRPGMRVIRITQRCGDAVLPIRVQEFDRSTINLQDMTEDEKFLYSVPFAITDHIEAKRNTTDFIWKSIMHYVKSHVTQSDQISMWFFKLASQLVRSHSPQSLFLQRVLFMWTAARTIEGDWFYADEERLDLPAGSVVYDAPFIDYQFSGIIKDDILLPTQRIVLQQLQDLIYKNHKKNWLSILVGTFILLNTYGLLMKQQRDFARSIQAKTRYSSMELICSIHHGAKVLLAHFHAVRGQKPFNDILRLGQEAQRVAKSAGLQDFQIEELRSLASLVREQVPRFTDLVKTDEYEEDHWFTGQLFLPDWKPPNTTEHAMPA